MLESWIWQLDTVRVVVWQFTPKCMKIIPPRPISTDTSYIHVSSDNSYIFWGLPMRFTIGLPLVISSGLRPAPVLPSCFKYII
jgi:hypothetical protein